MPYEISQEEIHYIEGTFKPSSLTQIRLSLVKAFANKSSIDLACEELRLTMSRNFNKMPWFVAILKSLSSSALINNLKPKRRGNCRGDYVLFKVYDNVVLLICYRGWTGSNQNCKFSKRFPEISELENLISVDSIGHSKLNWHIFQRLNIWNCFSLNYTMTMDF